MKVIILAGGGGSRLFPLSRTSFPKQFLKIGSDKTLLGQTFNRYLDIVEPKDIIVVTNKEYYYHVKAEIKECNIENAHVLLEPFAKNTTPAIVLAAKYILDNLAGDTNEILFISPSDHIIMPKNLFVNDVRTVIKGTEKNKIVTIGVRPNKPETGYGYIKVGLPWEYGHNVDEFVEKPDLVRAEQYVTSGNYYWNSGMYAFSINTFLEELALYQPEIYDLFMENSYQEIVQKFEDMPSISIDYAIAEKSRRVVTIPISSYWNDIGSWDAIYDAMQKDENKNVKNGDCMTIDCSDSLIIGADRLVVGIGLEDMIVVETDDVILVSKKGESQKVKEVVERLKISERKEAVEHTTSYKHWGNHRVIAGGAGYKVKKITLYPGQKILMQLHYHRSEHWIVTKGTAKIIMGEKERFISENESIFIPKAVRHMLENPGKVDLEIIEVQNGLYLEEDDVIRFETDNIEEGYTD
ncbi:MAG: mannose-1-phosphate guanylyltransferase/mannose-6-phosphate isomerase [Deltaproteobacteria bacterium]